ncbi:PITH domain-containing protein 1 [Selaginella moellendorffii]|nr:PITH domain-containing protein 1 [Selaginella moellendorffii]|eukprot:XP_002977781.2 PITH domain-containing protein 1 [Selaginella moellendorffii]
MASCTHHHHCADHSCAAEWSLHAHIDTAKVWALNEASPGSSKSVFKSWDQRLDLSGSLESNEDDPELILFIPFTTDVKIKSICVIGGTDGSSPSKMRAFINREDIDFSDARELLPVQEWDLAENLYGELEYPTRYPKFQGVANLTLHFPTNFGGTSTRIHYVGLKGESTKVNRDAVTNAVYEAYPNLSEHQIPGGTGAPEVS